MAETRRVDTLPRLPLEGSLDLTYRCNNRCRHCWLWEPDSPEVAARELTLGEVRDLVEEGRSMGCRRWNISGGEPMLRPDFAEILDCVTSRAAGYTLNTNGALITPQIARLMKRKGTKMVALYGATPETHDRITRNPGSFEQTMQGFAYLKQAGAGSIVQLIPMRGNFHEWEKMQALAATLSRHQRVGAPWLFLTACGSRARNDEIVAQRLPPRDVVDLDQPRLDDDEVGDGGEAAVDAGCLTAAGGATAGRGLYAGCIEDRRDFHVDPYGGLSFCCYVKDPGLRYDLRRGSLREGWEEFVPSLADAVPGDAEYAAGCSSCAARAVCRWCAVYGYLEHGRHGARVEYLCDVAREARAFLAERARDHRRYYGIAGMTIAVESDLPITDATFAARFTGFRVDGPGADTLTVRHHFGIPDVWATDLGEEVFRRVPWAVYRDGDRWTYVGIDADDERDVHRVAIFNEGHTRVEVFNLEAVAETWATAGFGSLTLMPTDQIMLARALADRDGCYFQSGAAVLDGRGLLFVGRSTAGKSTTMKMLADRAELLCDDRNIVRRGADGFRVYGTWSHGEVPIVSAASAPLRAIVFLRKARENRVERVTDTAEIVPELTARLIRPLVTADWWQKTLTLVEQIVAEVPCYEMRFDKSGAVVPELERLARS